MNGIFVEFFLSHFALLGIFFHIGLLDFMFLWDLFII